MVVPPAEGEASAKSVEVQAPLPNEPTAPESSTPNPPTATNLGKQLGRTTVTTQERAPMKVPESVHIRISPDNLKDYVGPPVYQKDRMYRHAPPPGVSTGLGYLGNGSGAVMPIEATVSLRL